MLPFAGVHFWEPMFDPQKQTQVLGQGQTATHFGHIHMKPDRRVLEDNVPFKGAGTGSLSGSMLDWWWVPIFDN